MSFYDYQQHLPRLRQQGCSPTKVAQELSALTDRIDVIEKLVAEEISSYSSLSDGHLSIIANAPRPGCR
ncbi:hypothetical protein EOA32_08570 [Mesorhizobium sp. M1A.F.Ca.ET.072.01.1.1]|uniref:hypothetical protein n=1 Tax=Mesorhizobium sp. M1A.F.Ca.ET.072.01.1.1 TaxID=2496753 RepID=UPI000FD4050D|nr:hypothetical protein [Mesorhizobium sp. M1A.F.Ca.ET.072.01.1.1]RUW53627.1 hypothetical protein EOA32_08570 [Mesorhizobium sp. M1A.F.Ca.ET.072.01.1.1]TIV04387.1 MAG: hypothetical protein E5W04_03755 [Mesorhizobium sp.]